MPAPVWSKRVRTSGVLQSRWLALPAGVWPKQIKTSCVFWLLQVALTYQCSEHLFGSEISSTTPGVSLEVPWLSWSAVAAELPWKDNKTFSAMVHNQHWQGKVAWKSFPQLLSPLSWWGCRWARTNILHVFYAFMLLGGVGLLWPDFFMCLS